MHAEGPKAPPGSTYVTKTQRKRNAKKEKRIREKRKDGGIRTKDLPCWSALPYRTPEVG